MSLPATPPRGFGPVFQIERGGLLDPSVSSGKIRPADAGLGADVVLDCFRWVLVI